jgi:hypothetical protein
MSTGTAFEARSLRASEELSLLPNYGRGQALDQLSKPAIPKDDDEDDGSAGSSTGLRGQLRPRMRPRDEDGPVADATGPSLYSSP